MKRQLFSPGFLCALVGTAVTLLAYLDIWFWPAWPAFALLEGLFHGGSKWTALPYGVRAAVVVGLIVINIAFWSGAARLVWWLWMRIRAPRSVRR